MLNGSSFVLPAKTINVAMPTSLVSTEGEDRTAGAEPASALAGSPWLDRLEVVRLKKQLVQTGYSLRIDDSLGPVTKSALADYLQLDRAHPLGPFLVRLLRKTVITGRRDPQAWNNYFGLDRPTRFVERPLTGPGGQLDANGNLRAAVPED